MLNYPLTEFSLKELTLLSEAICEKIDVKQAEISRAKMLYSSGLRREVIRKYNDGMPELREMHVRVLTAIDIVKQKETTNAN